MTFARSNVQLPSLTDEELNLDSGKDCIKKHDFDRTFLESFIHSIELFDILSSSLRKVYHSWTTRTDHYGGSNRANYPA